MSAHLPISRLSGWLTGESCFTLHAQQLDLVGGDWVSESD